MRRYFLWILFCFCFFSFMLADDQPVLKKQAIGEPRFAPKDKTCSLVDGWTIVKGAEITIPVTLGEPPVRWLNYLFTPVGEPPAEPSKVVADTMKYEDGTCEIVAKLEVKKPFKGLFSVYTCDFEGEKNASNYYETNLIVDTHAPAVSIWGATIGMNKVTLHLEVNDRKEEAVSGGLSEISYTIDGKEKVVCRSYTEGFQYTDTYELVLTTQGTYELVITVTDHAGNQTVSEPIEVTVNKETSPVCTVFLPEVEGVHTDPEAGQHLVFQNNPFYFTLTLDDAYSDSTPLVTTSQGDTLQMELGRYVIPKVVRSNLFVTISGIKKNSPTANEVQREVCRVWCLGECLYVQTDWEIDIWIYTYQGKLYKQFRSARGTSSLPLGKGVWIVRVGERVYKVVI